MTAADIILIFIGIIGLLIAFGSFVIAVTKVRKADLQFSQSENLCLFSIEIRIISEKIMPTLSAAGWAPLTER